MTCAPCFFTFPPRAHYFLEIMYVLYGWYYSFNIVESWHLKYRHQEDSIFFPAMLGLHIVALVLLIRESFLFILKRFLKFLNHVSPRSFPSFSEELGMMELPQAAMDCLLEEEFKISCLASLMLSTSSLSWIWFLGWKFSWTQWAYF